MYTLYLLIDIVYVYHSSHVNKYEANKIINFFSHLKYLTKSIHFNQFMYIYISEIYTVFISLMVVQKQTLSIYKLTVQEIVTVWHGWIGWMSRYKSILGNGGVYFFMKNKSKK